MRLLAFQGLRYTPRAGDPGRLAAPPYDQIDDAARDRLHAASPFQFVHLTRPVAVGSPASSPATLAQHGPADPYRHAAELHDQWLRAGIVARDAQPALYPYVVALAGGGHRLGVMALVGYAPETVIRPHEQTLDKPLADRTALLAAMRVDLEPALLLAEDDGRLEALLAADLAGDGEALAAPLVDYGDADGHRHLLFRIAGPGRIAAYQHAVDGRPAAIADGHHRYKVGLRFAAAHHAAPGTAAAAKLAVVTSMSSRRLTIDPIHRALQQPIDAARLAAVRISAAPFRGASGAELARAVEAAPQPALGVWVAGRPPEIWQLAAPATPAPPPAAALEPPPPRTASAAPHPPPPPLTTPAALAALNPRVSPPPLAQPPPLVVEIFQQALLPALGLAAEAATDGTLIYRSNADELFDQVARGELGTGFWLPPMRPADFAAAIAKGELLPPKSTRFLPKAMSGLVWSDHQSKVI